MSNQKSNTPEAFAQLVQHSGTVQKSIKVPPVWESIAARCKAFAAAVKVMRGS